jgi:ribonucleoside-triphosphate reductase
MAQKHWSDQAVSVSVYYKKEEIPKIKEWLRDNLAEIKTISFLAHGEHGFKQAPKETITKEQFEKLSEGIKPIDVERIGEGELESQECAGGVCPVK